MRVHYLVRVDEGRVLTQRGQLEVKVVAVKLGLDRVSAETEHVCLELFIFLVLPVLIDVLLVEIILLGGNKGCNQLSVPEVVPREVS